MRFSRRPVKTPDSSERLIGWMRLPRHFVPRNDGAGKKSNPPNLFF